MTKGIAFRRAKLASIKRQRKHWRHNSMTPKAIGLASHTPKPCSCWMCGNARHHQGRTQQERKQLASYALGIEEVGGGKAA